MPGLLALNLRSLAEFTPSNNALTNSDTVPQIWIGVFYRLDQRRIERAEGAEHVALRKHVESFLCTQLLRFLHNLVAIVAHGLDGRDDVRTELACFFFKPFEELKTPLCGQFFHQE